MDACKEEILLINAFSWTLESRACYLPYGILYLAGFLRDRGVSACIYDRNADHSLDIKKCLDYFKQKKPLIVGISVLSGPVISDALKISREIKSISSQTYIVWGGLHPTIFPEYVLKEKSVDFIIQGEGELVLYELSQALLHNRNYKDIKNLGFRDNATTVLNPIRAELVDLEINSMPAWDMLDMRYYLAKRFFANRVLTVCTSRGCPFKCSFCFNQGLLHQRWRGLSAVKIKQQIDYLYSHYGINGIQFYEDSFDTDKKRVRQFSDLMIQSKMNQRIKWSHFSNIAYFNKETVAYEMQAGLRYIEYGVESGSQRILDWVNKAQTIGQIRKVFKECQGLGIKTAALFMIGFPDETLEELNMTVDLVEELPAHILICTIYRPYPGTPLFDYCVKENMFKPPERVDDQAEFYRFSHMAESALNFSHVPTKLLLSLQKRFYAKFAISEAILCLKNANLALFFYYLKQQLNPRAFLYTLKALITRFVLTARGRSK